MQVSIELDELTELKKDRDAWESAHHRLERRFDYMHASRNKWRRRTRALKEELFLMTPLKCGDPMIVEIDVAGDPPYANE